MASLHLHSNHTWSQGPETVEAASETSFLSGFVTGPQCTHGDYEAIWNLSKLCVLWRPDAVYDCFPASVSHAAGIFSGVWDIINMVVGIFGNLLTLLAIPYFTKKSK